MHEIYIVELSGFLVNARPVYMNNYADLPQRYLDEKPSRKNHGGGDNKSLIFIRI